MIIKRAAAIGAIVVSSLILSGCFLADQGTVGNATIKRAGTNVVIAVCEEAKIGYILFSERTDGVSEEDEIFWESQLPDLSLLPGDELSSDPELTPLSPGEIRRAPALNPGDTLLVALALREGEPPPVSAQFTIPDEGLSENEWLRQNGSMSKDKC